MLFLHLFCGVREKRGKEWGMAAEKGAKRNLTWGEWVGDQRLAVAALVGEDGAWEMWEQSPWLQWGHSKRARTILKPGQETSVVSLRR